MRELYSPAVPKVRQGERIIGSVDEVLVPHRRYDCDDPLVTLWLIEEAEGKKRRQSARRKHRQRKQRR